MDALFNEVQIDPRRAALTVDVGQTSGSPRVLSPHEVSAVAGGPEADVGSGIQARYFGFGDAWAHDHIA